MQVAAFADASYQPTSAAQEQQEVPFSEAKLSCRILDQVLMHAEWKPLPKGGDAFPGHLSCLLVSSHHVIAEQEQYARASMGLFCQTAAWWGLSARIEFVDSASRAISAVLHPGLQSSTFRVLAESVQTSWAPALSGSPAARA